MQEDYNKVVGEDIDTFVPPSKESFPAIVGKRLLVIPCSPPEKTKGGIILAENTREDMAALTGFGYVLDVGAECYHPDLFVEPFCKEGDWVIFSKHAGHRFKMGKPRKQVVMLKDTDVIAVARNKEQLRDLYSIENL